MLQMDVRPSQDPFPLTRVLFGRGVAEDLAASLPSAALVLLVADDAIRGSAVVAAVRSSIASAGLRLHESSLVAREENKTVATCERLWDEWIGAGAGRDAVVVALGGGLTSDVAGFAAACLHRGVPWVIVPTTTLAMADAALGGKTAVNASEGKNLVGALHHPHAILADLGVLDGLPPGPFADGFAEVVKAAVVGDASLLDAVEAASPRLRARDADAAAPLLFAALRVKAEVVEADAREASRREILNFGHTVAHAIEHATSHAVSHGRAVAAGLVAEALLAERLGRLPAHSARRIGEACEACNLPWRLERAPDRDALIAAMIRDKKTRARVVRVALPEGLGRHGAAPGTAVDAQELASLLGAAP